ncbi:MAG: hypothetical protein JXR82_01120, partial [Marinifilaceae bacterium]|nr:hypothetical protein [Marinifilaceae bacterium]
MKFFGILLLLALLLSCSPSQKNKAVQSDDNESLVSLVNPLMGTDSEYKLSNGNTYPAIARPWGM